jgi:hypothetical protein
LHHRVIRRFMPWAYWVRENADLLLATDTSATVPRRLGQLDRGVRRIRRRIVRRGPDATLDRSHADVLRGELWTTFRDILSDRSSVAATLFGAPGTTMLLGEHETGARNHVDLLGHLVTVERWRRLARAIADDARSELGSRRMLGPTS